MDGRVSVTGFSIHICEHSTVAHLLVVDSVSCFRQHNTMPMEKALSNMNAATQTVCCIGENLTSCA